MMFKTIANVSLFLVLIFAWLGGFSNPVNAQGPENTLVVVNKDSQDSLAVANHYIHLRKIPAVNVVYLNSTTTDKKLGKESSDSKSFKREILDPLLKAMRDRGIENQIDCVAYSAGFPTRFNFFPEVKTYLANTNKTFQRALHAPWTSITSLTYFHLNAFSRSPNFLELDANHYANPHATKILANPFTGKDATKFDTAIENMKAADYDQAKEELIALGRVHRQQIPVLYNLAKCFAAKRERKKSLTLLQGVKDLGFSSKSLLANDKGFANIRSLPEFQDITSSMEDLPDWVTPTRSFSGQYFWAKNGWPSGNNSQGERYLLSSVLAVTGKNQSSLAASIARLESSAGVDGTAPSGNVYFADHADVRSKTRKGQFRFAIAELKSLGRSASIGSKIYPVNDQRVIGATLGSGAPKWNKSNSRFLSGAICDNLTSYGAWWQQTQQTQITEWLDAGAAGASGTVCEPRAFAAKFPSTRWHAHYARGSTLAESFFQSVSGPFQLLLVGDPLCCPFGKFPQFEVKGLEEGATVTKNFVLQVDHAAAAPQVKHYEVYYDGVLLGKVSDSNQISVAIDAMNDGYHEMRVVGVTRGPIENRTPKIIGFQVDRKGQHVNFKVDKSQCTFGSGFVATATSTTGKHIKIRQNSRTIATMANGGSVRISSTKLGLGKSQLRADVELENGSLVRSVPIKIEVTSN